MTHMGQEMQMCICATVTLLYILCGGGVAKGLYMVIVDRKYSLLSGDQATGITMRRPFLSNLCFSVLSVLMLV